MPEDGTPFVLFLESLEIASVHKYAGTLRRILDLAEGRRIPRPALEEYIATRSAEAALHEPTTALPLSREWLAQFWHQRSANDRLGLWLSTKTASRWSDVSSLVRGSFLAVTKNDAVIHFGFEGRIKTARRRRTKDALQHFVHLRSRQEEEEEFASPLRALVMSAKPGDVLFPTTTAAMERWLATLPVEPALQNEYAWEMQEGLVRTHYSAHSLKTGALRSLARLGAMGLVDEPTIGLMGKHKPDTAPMPKQTVAYLRRVPEFTKMGKTGQATLLL